MLYSINDVKVEYDKYSTLKDNTENHNRRMFSSFIYNANSYKYNNPNIYVSKYIYYLFLESINKNYPIGIFVDKSTKFIGKYLGYDMYFSPDLEDDEYVIHRNMIDIKQYKRKYKLKKIMKNIE
jgi:hypothetical protein